MVCREHKPKRSSNLTNLRCLRQPNRYLNFRLAWAFRRFPLQQDKFLQAVPCQDGIVSSCTLTAGSLSHKLFASEQSFNMMPIRNGHAFIDFVVLCFPPTHIPFVRPAMLGQTQDFRHRKVEVPGPLTQLWCARKKRTTKLRQHMVVCKKMYCHRCCFGPHPAQLVSCVCQGYAATLCCSNAFVLPPDRVSPLGLLIAW